MRSGSDEAQRRKAAARAELNRLVGRVFTPAAPVGAELFTGRIDQLRQVFDAVSQPGLHAIVYGERGVGKTSLASVAPNLLNLTDTQAVQASCDSTDSFTTVWHKVERGIGSPLSGRMGFGATGSSAFRLPGDIVTPDDVLQLVDAHTKSKPLAVVVDEFDRLNDRDSKRLFAETIKLLSDRSARGTVILIGIADNIEELLGEHRSIERAVVQVRMPRMSSAEIRELVQKGLGKVGLSVEPDALELVVNLASGLPHYAHLLGLHAARSAIDLDKPRVDSQAVQSAVNISLQRAHEGVMSAYHRATFSSRETIYQQVVLACALAPSDELGYFAPLDVREPLSSIMGRRYEIPAFARHLDALASESRGRILERTGVPRRFRFRFTEPLLQPYAIMKGIALGVLDPSALRRLGGDQRNGRRAGMTAAIRRT